MQRLLLKNSGFIQTFVQQPAESVNLGNKLIQTSHVKFDTILGYVFK